MTIAEGAKYVAAAYAVILAVLIIYYFMSARRVGDAAARRRAPRGRGEAPAVVRPAGPARSGRRQRPRAAGLGAV